MNNYVFSGIFIAAAFIVGWMLYFIAAFAIDRQGVLHLKGVGVNLQVIKGPLHALIPVLSVSVIVPFLRLPERAGVYANHIIHILLIALFGWLATKIVCVIRDALLSHYNMGARDNVHARGMHTQLLLIANIINVVMVLLIVSFALMSFESVRRIGVSVLASAGVVGIVIGFAAQKTLGNIIAGFQIAIAQPIRLDDVVIIEKEWGRIEEITLTFVVVRIWDLRRLVLPISYFLEKPFQNWTRTSADIMGTVYIYADYTVPVREVRSELTRILKESPQWDKKIDVLQVTNATDRTVELRALMSAADASAAWSLRCDVREKLLDFMQQRFPQCLPRLRVEMNEGFVNGQRGALPG
ncbi:MAG: mechanosensitive ion channel [Candidatus Omnitrophica bacterium]|jgi:small-conductance mechanosensitive channel|nr:mechanosensitive ion channel [Candidatus Omnitrophota bacterium]